MSKEDRYMTIQKIYFLMLRTVFGIYNAAAITCLMFFFIYERAWSVSNESRNLRNI
jgi:hypothetical protein